MVNIIQHIKSYVSRENSLHSSVNTEYRINVQLLICIIQMKHISAII